MTGKLAEKLPLTMSSLINTIPDSLYPEEDIPTSMNIFTNTESISHYSQMNTGELFLCFPPGSGARRQQLCAAAAPVCAPSCCASRWIHQLAFSLNEV